MEAITVSRFNQYIKQIFDSEELIHNVSIVGEVFGKSITRNVIYFSVKDEEATLSCVCFYPAFNDLIVEGAKVIITGSPNYYVRGGKLNFNVVKVEPIGIGNLYEEFLKLKQKLEDEGLFNPSNKKTLPKVINRIGVITSKEGAVIQDIKNVAWRRNPFLDIVLYNTRVQGIGAEDEIANAIDKLGNYKNIDLIIVARGGGSLEDLSAYNTEKVARATYNCPLPIISAVGHETDFTIIDFVSDLRAPTPSAAAELVTFNIEDKKHELKILTNSFYRAARNYFNAKIDNLEYYKMVLINNFEKKLSNDFNIISKLNQTILTSYENNINQRLYEIGLIENTLNKLNPQEILKRGYAKIEQNGETIKELKSLDKAKNFEIMFVDGKIKAKYKE